MSKYSKSAYFINRELSLLSFQERVVAQAQDPSLPLFERLRFLFIACKNIDEFFEVRVAEIKEKILQGTETKGPDGMVSSIAFNKISKKAHTLIKKIYFIYTQELLPSLEKEGIQFLNEEDWNSRTLAWLKAYFHVEVEPILSPVAIDAAHPFPKLVNRSLNFIVSLKGEDVFHRVDGRAVLHAPRALDRVILLPQTVTDKKYQLVLLSTVIKSFVAELFPGMTIDGCYQFRLTRNSDVILRDDDEVIDLADALKQKLYTRNFGNAARLEIINDCPEDIAKFLMKQHHLTEKDLYYSPGPVNLSRYFKIFDLIDRKELYFNNFIPNTPSILTKQKNYFTLLQETDLLLHHPYQSFDPVLNLIRQATLDKSVIAIKQTLYRTGPNSQVVKALIDAARSGIEVTAVIELRARFDEASNLELANSLQQAGALVVYGVHGYKTHAKMTLIVRREKKKLVRYCHLGTGNYHEATSKLYTDFGFLTYNKAITEDVQNIFLLLTGMCKKIKLKKLWYAPVNLLPKVIEYIRSEAKRAASGSKAHIMIRINNLTDPEVIEELYKASSKGVKIDLIVRGICCLRPGIKNVSENIRVISIVGRFLEHSRVYYFYRGGNEAVFCASSDWMERNLRHRIEVAFPIEDETLKKRIIDEGLLAYLKDEHEAWELDDTGQYTKISTKTNSKALSAQQMLLKKLSLYMKTDK